MQTLAQLLAITTPCQILEETATHTTVKQWNCKKSVTWHKRIFSKADLIKSAERDLKNAITDAQALQDAFNSVQIGDIVTYTIGYDCTLHQFAKVVKKTSKTLLLQLYDYQGMGKIAEPTTLIDEFKRVSVQKFWRYRPYEPNTKYYNNED
jgi:hypothetical protein